MPGISDALRKILRILEDGQVGYMLIGGQALPAYGRVRASLDIDIAVAMPERDVVERLRARIEAAGFDLPSDLIESGVACLYLFDRQNLVDVELWFRPDGVDFEQALRRRIRRRVLPDLSCWIIGPEDFIINKLARRDRGEIDEADVVSVLSINAEKLDLEYLRRRAQEVGVMEMLDALMERIQSLADEE